MKRLFALASASLLFSSSALAQSIFFTGFNADGNDNLSFVALSSINSGTSISFSDNELSPAGWVDNTESAFSWTATSNIAAGTIVTLNNLGAGTMGSNLGTMAAIAAGGSNRGLSNDNESVWAFIGSYAAPTSFLAAIGNDTLADTGNTANPATASLFIPGDDDVMAYIGIRSGLTSYAAYLPHLTNSANWVRQGGSGDQSVDGITPDVPFSTTAFTVIPEPSTTAAVMAGVVLLGAVFGRRRFARV